MKFMMSCRQPLVFLKEANEIKVNYNDIERLADFVTDDWTCEAEIIIYLPKDQVINWEQINNYKNILNITIAAEDTRLIKTAQSYDYRTFWSYPASTFQELRSLLHLGVNQVLLDAPLYFDLPKVKNICGDVEIRLVVNKCFNTYLPQKNGICGTYIRPEDIEAYSAYVDHFEFDTDNIQKEHTLYKIYTQDKTWPGNLNILLTNLNADVDNRGFEILPNDEEDNKFFAHRRMTCGQKCQSISNCNFCVSTFNLINRLQQTATANEIPLSKEAENLT